MSETSERKTHAASNQKLRKLREDGAVPQGAEVSAYLGQFAVFLYLSLAGKFVCDSIKSGISWSLNQTTQPFELVLENALHNTFLLFVYLAGPVVFALIATVFIVSLIYNKGFIFSTKRISPKFENISPAKGLSQIFGMRGMIEFCVSLSRLILWSLTFLSIIWFWFDDLIKSPVCGLSCIFQISLLILIKILGAVLVLYVVFVVVEALVQKFIFSKDQRMTKSEVKKEQRDQHGTPEVRNARRRFRNDLEASFGMTK
jgi:type III secretion protein U